jgi:predicted nucleotidyltransferase
MIPAESLDEYVQGARKRYERDTRLLDERRQKAWQLARKAGALLREKYHASRVVVFGSIIRKELFTPWSDVDIAAWGIPSDQTFKAIGDILLIGEKIELNLVDVNTCSPGLLKTIEIDGVDV